MNRKKLLTLSLLALAALLLSVPAFADSITITLASPFQVGTFNTTVSFWATVSAPSTNSAPVYLNSDSFNVDAPLVVDDTAFLTNFPLVLGPGASTTAILFTVPVPYGTPVGYYFGYFQILGGADGSQLNPVSNVAQFEIYAVPEPGTMLLLGSGGLALFGTPVSYTHLTLPTKRIV